MLTGKCKEDFNMWYTKKYVDEYPIWLDNDIVDFEKNPFAFQQGVYLEFFREKGYIIIPNAQFSLDGEYGFYYRIYNIEKQTRDESGMFPDYNTALTQAIEQANKIYNEK